MRALVISALGEPPEAVIRDIATPMPAAGEVRIAVAAIGLSFVDALIAAGRYQVRPDLPWIPGSECAGVIDAVGDSVSELAVGDRVCALGWHGVAAERVCVPMRQAILLPPAIEMEIAAVVRVAYSTAWHALVDRAAARRGERLLVLGASGAVGRAAIAIGAWLGLAVTAVTRRAAQCDDLSALGATAVFDAPQLAGEADLVFDPIGGEWTAHALKRVAPGGRLCVIGFAAGAIPSLAFNKILLREISVIGVSIGAFTRRDPEAARANVERILELAGDHIPLPRIAHRFALADAAAALALAGSGRALGRVVLQT